MEQNTGLLFLPIAALAQAIGAKSFALQQLRQLHLTLRQVLLF
jgi:hypothetical protein